MIHRVCRFASALSSLAIGASIAVAQDWPQFLGPNRDLKTTCPNLKLEWNGTEPPVMWKKEIGSGWSGPVVAGSRLVLHHRDKDEEVVAGFDALTGEPRWESRTETSYRDSLSSDFGPRATPVISGGRVFTFGAGGRLRCLELETGREVWSVDTAKQYRAGTGFFGMGCSPLVEGELVIVQIGGKPAHGVVAFETATGKLRWHATDHEAGYAAPVAANVGGQRRVLCFTREGLVGLDPVNGNVQFQFPWRAKMHASVNAASPIVMGDRIFLSASYGTGAILLHMSGFSARPVWQGDNQISSHYASLVHHRDMLFGFHGRVDFPTGAELRAIDAKTGEVLWKMDPIRSGTLLLVNDSLFTLTEDGELYVAPASFREFRPILRTQVLGADTRANAAFAQGIYYARGKGRLVAVDFRQSTAPAP